MLLHLFIILTLNFIISCNYITYMLRLQEFQHDFDNLIYTIFRFFMIFGDFSRDFSQGVRDLNQ